MGETVPGAGEAAVAVVDVQTTVILHPPTTPARGGNHPHKHRTRKGGGLGFGPAQAWGDLQPIWRRTADNIRSRETRGGDGSMTTKQAADFFQAILVTGIMITGKETLGEAGQALQHHLPVRPFRPRDMKVRGLDRRADDKSLQVT